MTTQPPDELRDMLRTAQWAQLSGAERSSISEAMHRVMISRDTNREFLDARTRGERAADRIAEVGGSWGFIASFGVFLVIWAVLNTVVFSRARSPDPYPYTFLNLLLSMLAALQAPIIMMSQSRMAKKDRLDASADYQVNLNAEIAVRAVQAKLDVLHGVDWPRLVELQEEQIALLRRLVERHPDVTD